MVVKVISLQMARSNNDYQYCKRKRGYRKDQCKIIEAFAREKNIGVIGRVPFDPAFTKAMVQGKTIVEFDSQSEGCKAVKGIWKNVKQRLEI